VKVCLTIKWIILFVWFRPVVAGRKALIFLYTVQPKGFPP